MPFKNRFVTFACLLALGLGAAWGSRPAAADDPEVDVTVFYSALEPHGEWMHVQPFGWVWTPDNVDYGWRPYSVGHWTWVEPYGWMWVSDEPWAWATYHYGRWIYLEDYGWAWVPGTVWAPAWVVFRYGDPWVGWAPMPPEPNWRPDAGFDAAALELDASVPTHAWTFVPLRHFPEPDLRSRAVAITYNPFLVQRTRRSTRYVAVTGGFANLSIDVAVLEKARGAPVPRRRLQVAPALPKGSGVQIAGDAVIVYRPRVMTRPQAQAPAPRVRVHDGRGPEGGLDAWTARRQAMLKAHLDAQRKALETPGMIPFDPRTGLSPEDEAKRRESDQKAFEEQQKAAQKAFEEQQKAAQKALEEEQKRLERLLERQRKRLERPPPPGKPDDGPGRGKDRDKGDDDDKDDGRRKKDDD